MYIFEKIKELSRENLNLKVITFIKNFTESCYSRNQAGADKNRSENLYGLPLLWDFMKDYPSIEESSDVMRDNYSPNNIETIEACVGYISDLTNSNNVDEAVKEKFLTMCMENIKNSKSVLQSFILSKKIYENIQYQKRRKVLKKLDEDFNVLSLIINDFQRYMNLVKNAIPSDKPLIESNSLMKTIFEGYYNHHANISTRLHIIYSFIPNGQDKTISFDPTHIDQLWDMLIIKANIDDERCLLYEFLREEFSQGFYEYVFDSILNNKDKFSFRDISMSGYLLYERYFYLVNYNNKKLILDNKYYRVQSEDIIGLDSLWLMLTEVLNEDVRNNLCRLLVLLCTSLKIYSEEFCTKYWHSFFEKMFEKLNFCYENKMRSE